MCTAITYQTKDFYFGRNLDYEVSYGEAVTITPRNYPFSFYTTDLPNPGYAMIGMASSLMDYPLYYDATNEWGLSMAALNFPGNAVYFPEIEGLTNVPPYAFIPWVLVQCKTVKDAKDKMKALNLVDMPIDKALPLTPLHWIIADKNECIVVESTASGLNIYENPVGVLTNNPPFEYHLQNLANYLNLTRAEPTNRISENIELKPYSRGMGGIGLPGDLSSASRFVRAAFAKLNSVSEDSEDASISQFFHILGCVEQQRGCAEVNGKFEITMYSSCCNTDKGVYYYKTYENSQLTAFNMFHEDLNGNTPIRYPLITKQQIHYRNGKPPE